MGQNTSGFTFSRLPLLEPVELPAAVVDVLYDLPFEMVPAAAGDTHGNSFVIAFREQDLLNVLATIARGVAQ